MRDGQFFSLELESGTRVLARMIHCRAQLMACKEWPFIYIWMKPWIHSAETLSRHVPPDSTTEYYITDASIWNKGFATPLLCREILDGETFPRHVFEKTTTYGKEKRRYCDELGNDIEDPPDPCPYKMLVFGTALDAFVIRGLQRHSASGDVRPE
jgi:hypothetical protein